MANQDDVRRIALGLPETAEARGAFRFLVEGKPFIWAWAERVDPRRARVPNPEVIAARVASDSDKELLIELDPGTFFTEAHYDGFPAILVRLPRVEPELLRTIVTDAWRCRASRKVRARVVAGK